MGLFNIFRKKKKAEKKVEKVPVSSSEGSRLKQHVVPRQPVGPRPRLVRVLYCDVSGDGPYHEEERAWLEKESGNTYVIRHSIRAPMAFACDHAYRFRKDISLTEFVAGFFTNLPYARFFDKDDVRALFRSLQNSGIIKK